MPTIIVDKEKCIGCGACVALCKNFKLDSNGKAEPVKAEVDKITCVHEAASNCPVDAIKIKE